MARSSGSRAKISASEPKTTTLMKKRNHGPIELCVKEWIELTIPERVRKVPKSESENASSTSKWFQTRSMPRFSWIITECEKRGRGEPGHQRRVLDGVPGVVAAPADLLVGPVRAQ